MKQIPPLDAGLIEITKRVVKSFMKCTNYKHTDKDELFNEIYCKLKEELLDKPLSNNTPNLLYSRGMSIAATHVRKNKPTGYGMSERDSIINSFQDRLYTIPNDKLTDRQHKFKAWCSTRNDRWFKSIDSRLIAYLFLVEEMSIYELASLFNRTTIAIQTTIYSVSRKVEVTTKFKQHDVVLLKMDNPFFNNMIGRVKEHTDYGAVVLVESHNYPQRIQWELRCTTDEMLYLCTLDEKELVNKVSNGKKIAGSHKKVSHAADMGKYEIAVQAMGEACQRCGVMALVRTGTCITCQACGDSSGGCG